jgi:hypothetical protein
MTTYDDRYAAAVAMSASRVANNPWMRCRACRRNVQAYTASTYCDNGVHHFRCDCGAHWDSTRDWEAHEWMEFARSQWISVHGREPSPEILAWLSKEGPYPGDSGCDCPNCERHRKALADRTEG